MINQSETPLVSVIIPAYNAEKFIERTLNSVLNQTYRNLEVLIIDDGSQDRTETLVQEWMENDSRIRFFQQKNSGVAAARNLGIKQAKGDLIAPVDADDIWYPQYLEKVVAIFGESDLSVGIVYAWSIDIDEEDQLMRGFHVDYYEGDIYLKLLYRNFIGNASATVIRRQCFEKMGYYSEKLRSQKAQGCEDWDLYLRLAEVYQFRVIPEFLVGYRQLSNSMSKDYSAMAKSLQLVLEKVQKRHPNIPPFIYQWSLSNFYIYLAHKSNENDQYQEALKWLAQALRLDPIMVLIRHDLYVLILFYFVQSLRMPMKKLSPFKPSHLNPSSPPEKITLKDIEMLIKLQQWLPSRRYEQARLEWLNRRSFKSLIEERGKN